MQPGSQPGGFAMLGPTPSGETFPPVTMGRIRGHGCRDLLVYCGAIGCTWVAVSIPAGLRFWPIEALANRVWWPALSPRHERTTVMAKLRHVAMSVPDPAATA